jgi:hydroxymethylglutaryl-CoA reductase
MQVLTGFSKLNITEKIDILKKYVPLSNEQIRLLTAFYDNGKNFNGIIEKISENYISNFSLPFSIAPNFRVNDKWYFVPMVTEESSIVAAAAYAAKFWCEQGGFHSDIIGTKKTGQIYFSWNGNIEKLQNNLPLLKEKLLYVVKPLTVNMEKRGGGISDITLNLDHRGKSDYHIVNVEFETADSMGANLINSCLETMGSELKSFIKNNYSEIGSEAEILMAILSNFTPECLVECYVECDINQLSKISGNLSPKQFAGKFGKAVQIAHEYIPRAVTHNKGIFNGVDAVLLATGNDFRAVEACGHAYAAKDGNYTALTEIEISLSRFRYKLRMPLSIGTVGGTTSVHPIARLALQIMQNPSARELMQVVASVGLASNFAAIRSLITDGIQKGHMKLHLNNILFHFNVTESEKTLVEEYFKGKQYSFKAVSDYLANIRANV